MLEKIRNEILPLIQESDCYLDDIIYEQEKNEWYLRIYIEKNNDYLDMETCVEVSEKISKKLDEIDVIKDEYYLEVSSPGIEKPLRNWNMIVDNIDSYVHIDFKDPKQGMNEIEGYLIDAKDNIIKLQYFVKGVKKKIDISYDNVKLIRLAIKF